MIMGSSESMLTDREAAPQHIAYEGERVRPKEITGNTLLQLPRF
jgi:hypothetical protein